MNFKKLKGNSKLIYTKCFKKEYHKRCDCKCAMAYNVILRIATEENQNRFHRWLQTHCKYYLEMVIDES